MFKEIESKIKRARRILESLNYFLSDIQAQDLVDFMSTETLTGDTINLNDVLKNEYFLIHELVEINEWKKRGINIHKRLFIDSPRTLVYMIHLTALEKELEYALQKRDHVWIEKRIRGLLKDTCMPEEIKPLAISISEKFIKIIESRDKS